MIKNFKCIKSLEIELAPLTIFVGPNGSGKSSILEALALMSQSIVRNEKIENAVKGELVDYDGFGSIVCGGIKKEVFSLGIKMDVKAEEIRKYIKKDIEEFSHEMRIKEPYSKAYLDFLGRLCLEKDTVEVSYTYSTNIDRSIFEHSYSVCGQRIAYKYEKEKGEICEPRELYLSEYSGFPPMLRVATYLSNFSDGLAYSFKKRLSNVYYLSAERGSIPWIYEAQSSERRRWVGRRGEYTLEVLAELMKPANDEKRLPYELFCEKFGIKYAWAGWESRNILTSNYRDPYLMSSHKFPSLGYGSRQLLPVIVQLAYSDPGSVILVEEPEISLHPSYQRLLPALFGRAVNEGKQILVTTHSSYFPLSLNIVLEGYKLEGQTTRGWRSYEIKVSVNDIAIYHVERGRDGYTKVKRIKLDRKGLKEGIPSFIEVENDILKGFMAKE